MTQSNEAILAKHHNEPAPLLSVLQDFHDRDGYLSEDVLRAVGEDLKIPIADLFGTVTFYHHFSREPGGRDEPRVCTGPICCLKGSKEMLAELKKSSNATAMPCAGRCDEPIPVIVADRVLVGQDASVLKELPSPLPPPNPGGITECVFKYIRSEGRASLKGYRKTEGYLALENAIKKQTPSDVIKTIAESGLAGRGGAGFPTGVKWKAVAEAEGEPKSIVCNADEGEPGCFKDRVIMDHDPHAMIEGMILAAYATGATRGFIYLRYEYPQTMGILETALQEAYDANLLGDHILGSEFCFELYLRRGAGAYICGEETSLLNSLEGKHPFPRNKPPYPVTHGLDNLPTVVNNVETLASVAPILVNGAQWYQDLSEGDHKGTKLISLSGDVKRPGNYEVPFGLPLSTLINDWAGGTSEGHTIKAVTMAGLSGGFLAKEDLDVTLDEPSIRSRGSFLGAGGIMVFDERRDMIKIAEMAMEFFAEESCGKCFPCRIGTQRLTERLGFHAGPDEIEAWSAEVIDIGETMKATSACGLGMAAPLISESLLKYFKDDIIKHKSFKKGLRIL